MQGWWPVWHATRGVFFQGLDRQDGLCSSIILWSSFTNTYIKIPRIFQVSAARKLYSGAGSWSCTHIWSLILQVLVLASCWLVYHNRLLHKSFKEFLASGWLVETEGQLSSKAFELGALSFSPMQCFATWWTIQHGHSHPLLPEDGFQISAEIGVWWG